MIAMCESSISLHSNEEPMFLIHRIVYIDEVINSGYYDFWLYIAVTSSIEFDTLADINDHISS